MSTAHDHALAIGVLAGDIRALAHEVPFTPSEHDELAACEETLQNMISRMYEDRP